MSWNQYEAHLELPRDGGSVAVGTYSHLSSARRALRREIRRRGGAGYIEGRAVRTGYLFLQETVDGCYGCHLDEHRRAGPPHEPSTPGHDPHCSCDRCF